MNTIFEEISALKENWNGYGAKSEKLLNFSRLLDQVW